MWYEIWVIATKTSFTWKLWRLKFTVLFHLHIEYQFVCYFYRLKNLKMKIYCESFSRSSDQRVYIIQFILWPQVRFLLFLSCYYRWNSKWSRTTPKHYRTRPAIFNFSCSRNFVSNGLAEKKFLDCCKIIRQLR